MARNVTQSPTGVPAQFSDPGDPSAILKNPGTELVAGHPDELLQTKPTLAPLPPLSATACPLQVLSFDTCGKTWTPRGPETTRPGERSAAQRDRPVRTGEAAPWLKTAGANPGC
jgi:hypothetical protein